MPGKRRLVVPLIAVMVVIAGIWGAIAAFNIKPRLGLDLRGGTSVTFAPHNPTGSAPTKQQIDTTIDIIRNRVNSKGVAESEVAEEGSNIVVSIPDVKNSDEVIRAVGTTAQLQFRPVLDAVTSGEPKYKQAPFDKVDCAHPETWLAKDKPSEPTVLCATESGRQQPAANAAKLQMGPVALGGTDITGAHAQIQQASNGVSTNQWETQLSFSGAGDRKFEKLTGQAACSPGTDPKREIAIVLDSVVINHPPVAEDSSISCGHGISGGNAVIQGQTQSEAEFLAPLISTGALPLTLENIDQNTVSATLGANSLHAGLIAGLLGLAATFVYVLLFYRGLGLVIWGGLLVAAALNVGIVLLMGRLIGFTLTLAGIAGLIVAIGISADSYVVFFERLKDEVREGRTLRTSVDRGWAHAHRLLRRLVLRPAGGEPAHPDAAVPGGAVRRHPRRRLGSPTRRSAPPCPSPAACITGRSASTTSAAGGRGS